ADAAKTDKDAPAKTDAKAADDTEKSKGDDAKESAAPTAESTDPIVQADKLVREARTQLTDGNREKALELAQKASSLDPKNVDASALATDLAADAVKALPALSATTASASASADVKAASD